MELTAKLKKEFTRHGWTFAAGETVSISDTIVCGNCRGVEVGPAPPYKENDYRRYFDYGTAKGFAAKHCERVLSIEL